MPRELRGGRVRGGVIVWRGEVRRDTEIRKGRLLYEKKKEQQKKEQQQRKNNRR